MKRNRTLVCLIARIALMVLALPTSRAAESGAGAVEGRVFNAATGAALANARVALEGTDRQVVTDGTGSFRFNGVPAGEVRVSVHYVGLASQSAAVQVPPGGTVQREFDLTPAGATAGTAGEVVRMDKFKVVEESQMSLQALAMNEQRSAPNIKNVVAADEFGDRGHENLGEFLHFLPGVAVDVPGDSGPASVSLRGFPSNNSGVLLDGAEVAGARSNTRALDLHDVPMVNVSRVEVTKVPTPDMPATGLGGSINLISRSGFENRRAVLSYELYTLLNSNNGFTFRGGHRNQSDSVSPRFVHPSFEINYLKPINKSLAITAGFSSTWRMKTHSADARDEIPTWNLVSGVQRDSVWQAPIQLYKSGSGQVGAEWKITPNDTLSANLQYREFSMEVHRSRMQVTYGAGVVGDAKFSQGAATGVGVATQGTGSEYEHKTNNRQAALRFRHNGGVWRFDASGSHSLANYAKADVDDGYFFTVPATIQNLVIRGDGIPEGGGVPTRYSAFSRTGGAVDIYDGANYSIDTATSNQIDNDTAKSAARMDLARDFATTVPVTVKVGASIDRMTRDARTFSKTWSFRPNGASDVTARLARNLDVFDEAFLAVAPKVYGVQLRDVSMRKIYNFFLEHPNWFVLDEPGAYQSFVTSSREFQETVTAGYVRADARMFKNRLWVVSGVRFEQTDVSGRGPLDDINAQYQRNANGTFVRNAAGQRVLITSDALALRKLRYTERGAHAESDYHGFYPSLNATYNLSDHFVLRGAYARTLGRPDTSFITPGTTVSDPDVANPTITVNNPALVPWTADNYDLSIESYNFKGGFGSVGVFQKNIRDFFGSVRTRVTPELLALYGLQNDGSLSNYEIATQDNVGDAKITGVEFNYRQSLTFLPAWANGFQIFVNATKLRLSGSTTADFTGFNPSKLAGGVNFIRARYFIKLNYSYQGETRRAAVGANAANGIPAGTYNYQGKRARLGISAQYSVSKRLSVYASIMDLGGFELLNRQYAASTPEYARGNRIQELGYYTTLGIKGSF